MWEERLHEAFMHGKKRKAEEIALPRPPRPKMMKTRATEGYAA